MQHQIHYLDDLGVPETGEAARALSIALEVFGVPVAVHKTEGPAYCITFLGIIVDTKNFELRLPGEKIQRLQTMLQSWSTRRSCTRKELESLLGYLSHAASMVRPGRTFIR